MKRKQHAWSSSASSRDRNISETWRSRSTAGQVWVWLPAKSPHSSLSHLNAKMAQTFLVVQCYQCEFCLAAPGPEKQLAGKAICEALIHISPTASSTGCTLLTARHRQHPLPPLRCICNTGKPVFVRSTNVSLPCMQATHSRWIRRRRQRRSKCVYTC